MSASAQKLSKTSANINRPLSSLEGIVYKFTICCKSERFLRVKEFYERVADDEMIIRAEVRMVIRYQKGYRRQTRISMIVPFSLVSWWIEDV